MGESSHSFCDHCGAANPPKARFCTVCGTSLTVQVAEGQHDKKYVPPNDVPAVPLVDATPPVPEVPAKSASPQQKILKGRYRLLRKIGAGGYGVVYKAIDTEFADRLVAIKELSQKGLRPEEIVTASENFQKEAFLLARLTHPNLPSIYDYFTENDCFYLVMSYIEGETLEAYLQRTPGHCLPAEKVLQMGIQLASVLSYLHTRKPPIIFRDLKPSNIMRTYQGQIYLIDFGIARIFKPGQAKDTMILGSPGYAAPEQYGKAQTTPLADIYSLGVTLHEMLSGLDPSQSPFQFVPLNLPYYPQLSLLISCMVEIDARKRPSSMANIQRELQRIFTGRSRPPVQHQRHKPRSGYPFPQNAHSVLPAPISASTPPYGFPGFIRRSQE